MHNKKAFTLAETLITLGIVGVVAAITLPTIVTNYQKKVTATRLKHAYSVLSQAIEQSEAINGEIEHWEFDEQMFDKYLLPYIKSIKKQNFLQNSSLGITYRQISGEKENGLYITQNPEASIYTLANGTQIFTSIWSTSMNKMSLLIDINGSANPNQFGKDLFYFVLSKKYKLYPFGRYNNDECTFPTEPNNDREILKNGTCFSYGCNKQGRGMWCGALIMTDGWEIASDYPW